MSRALIVYGYYDESDHFGNILSTTKNSLREQGIEDIDVVNTFEFTRQHLKNNKQDVSASTAEWFRGLRSTENDTLIKSQQDKILNSTHIIFIYPIWWESLPHYMLSWMSEVFRSVSFRLDSEGKPNPQWGGDRKVLIITTAGFNQTIRRENFVKLLPSQGLSDMKDKSDEEIDRLMNLAQTYPLITALNYAGLELTDAMHMTGVDKGDEPQVVLSVQQCMQKFLSQENISDTIVEKAMEEHKKPLILKREPVKQELSAPPAPSEKLAHKPTVRY